MLAHAFLTVAAASTIDPETGPDQHLRLTRNKLQQLLTALTAAPVRRIHDVLC